MPSEALYTQSSSDILVSYPILEKLSIHVFPDFMDDGVSKTDNTVRK